MPESKPLKHKLINSISIQLLNFVIAVLKFYARKLAFVNSPWNSYLFYTLLKKFIASECRERNPAHGIINRVDPIWILLPIHKYVVKVIVFPKTILASVNKQLFVPVLSPPILWSSRSSIWLLILYLLFVLMAFWSSRSSKLSDIARELPSHKLPLMASFLWKLCQINFPFRGRLGDLMESRKGLSIPFRG